jgi:hypothetical protein
MEALYQGASTALVLLGLAALLLGLAALWRSAADAKAQQQSLQLERTAHEQAAERRRERAAQDERRLGLLYALAPAAAAVLGHWLGRRRLPHELAPWAGCIPRPPCPVPPPLDDDTHVEIDLETVLQGVAELGLDRWLATVMRDARDGRVAPPVDDDIEPTPAVVHGMNG